MENRSVVLVCRRVPARRLRPRGGACWRARLDLGAAGGQLAELMANADLDALAGKDSTGEDRFVAALAFPGQLLVVSARYEVPIYVEDKIAKGEYREVYIDLNAASIGGTKVLVTDAGANGLRAMADTVDMFDAGSGIVRFDGDWAAQGCRKRNTRRPSRRPTSSILGC